MFSKLILSALVGTAAIVAMPASAATNLVTNGGFEDTSVAGSFEFGASYAGRSNAVTGWTSANASAYNILFNASTANSVQASTRYSSTGNEYLWASTGSPNGAKIGTVNYNFVALDGDASVRGALTQQITGLVVGQVYSLSFDWAAAQIHSRDGATTEQLQVGFGNDIFNTAVLSNVNHGFTGWQTVTTNFTAKSTSQLLSFLSIGTPSGLPPVALLDNVSLTAAVPEPASWAMMIVGFGAVGGAMRHSRRTKVAFA